MINKEQIEENLKRGWAILEDSENHRIMIDGRIQTRFQSRYLTDEWRDLNPSISTTGYKRTMYTARNKRTYAEIHRLIATYFIFNPENKPQVNHISGIKTDNSLSNLEWVTRSENVKHAYDIGLTKKRKGEAHGYSRLKEKNVIEIRGLAEGGLPNTEIAKLFKMSPSQIGLIVNRKSWTHI